MIGKNIYQPYWPHREKTMKHYGIQVHSQVRAGGIAVSARPTEIVDDVVSEVDCMNAYTTCRTNKIRNGMSPALASKYCKTLLDQCQGTTA